VTRAGSVSNYPVCSIVFLPTLFEIAGAEMPASVDGVSLVPLLEGKNAPDREALFWHYPHYSNQGGAPSGAVRKGPYKLIEFYEDGRLELFNLAHDLAERRNLAARERERAKELHSLLQQWRASVRASMPKVNPGYDPAKAGQGLTGAEKPTPPQ
jgi:arylsulfatase A-like enzyme